MPPFPQSLPPPLLYAHFDITFLEHSHRRVRLSFRVAEANHHDRSGLNQCQYYRAPGVARVSMGQQREELEAFA